jgi:hypothetical protein
MPINLNIPGQLTQLETKAIELTASLVPEKGVIVEVGSLLGLSSWIWAKSADPSVTVYCIDPWESQGSGGNFGKLAESRGQRFTKEQFLKNVADCTNIVALQGYSPKDFQDWTRTIDLYFEDAVHTDPTLTANIGFWSHHLNINGILCGHDFLDRFPDIVREARRNAFEKKRQLWIFDAFWMVMPEAVLHNPSHAMTIAALKQIRSHYEGA